MTGFHLGNTGYMFVHRYSLYRKKRNSQLYILSINKLYNVYSGSKKRTEIIGSLYSNQIQFGRLGNH